MKTITTKFRKATIILSALIATFFSGLTFVKAQTAPGTVQQPLPSVGTSAILGTALGISVEVKTQSPSNEETPLQIICVFEYTEGDIFTSPPALPAAANGIVHIGKQLNGLITDLRKSGKFAGHTLETLLITPPKGAIATRQLLLIGLGDRNKFTPDLMTDIGRIGMREAMRLGVQSYAHASDLKDGGVDSPTATVASNVLKGALDAYQTQIYLQSKNASAFKPIKKITLLAGPPFYGITGAAITETIKAINKE